MCRVVIKVFFLQTFLLLRLSLFLSLVAHSVLIPHIQTDRLLSLVFFLRLSLRGVLLHGTTAIVLPAVENPRRNDANDRHP